MLACVVLEAVRGDCARHGMELLVRSSVSQTPVAQRVGRAQLCTIAVVRTVGTAARMQPGVDSYVLSRMSRGTALIVAAQLHHWHGGRVLRNLVRFCPSNARPSKKWTEAALEEEENLYRVLVAKVRRLRRSQPKFGVQCPSRAQQPQRPIQKATTPTSKSASWRSRFSASQHSSWNVAARRMTPENIWEMCQVKRCEDADYELLI